MSKETAEVIRRFRDKHTQKIHTPGDKETGVYDGTDERIRELREKGFLEGFEQTESVEQSEDEEEVIETKEDDKTVESDVLPNGTKKDLLPDLTIEQLQDVAKECNIVIPKKVTKKDDIIAFLSDKR